MHFFALGLTITNAKLHYQLCCYLPGIKKHIAHFSNQDEEAKKKAESILLYWIDKSKIMRR